MSRVRAVEGKDKVNPEQRGPGTLRAVSDAKRMISAHDPAYSAYSPVEPTPGSTAITLMSKGQALPSAMPPAEPAVAFDSAVRKAAKARRWIRVRNELQANGLLISLTARGSYRARLLFATCAAACALTLGALLTDAAEARETSEAGAKGTTSGTVVRLVENNPNVTYEQARRAGEIAVSETENSKGVGRYLKELAKGGATPRIEAHNAYLAGMGGEELAAAYADEAKDNLKDKKAKDETGGELAAAKPQESQDKTQDKPDPSTGKNPVGKNPKKDAGKEDGRPAPAGIPDGELAMAKFEPAEIATGEAADTPKDSQSGSPERKPESAPLADESGKPGGADSSPGTEEAFAEYVATGDDTALEGAVQREVGQTTGTPPPDETPADLSSGDASESGDPQDDTSAGGYPEGDTPEGDTEVAYAPESGQDSGTSGSTESSTDSSEPYTAQKDPETAPQGPTAVEPAPEPETASQPVPESEPETATETPPQTGGAPSESDDSGYDDSGYDDSGYDDSGQEDSMSDTEQAYEEYRQTGDDTALTNVIDGEISGDTTADTNDDQKDAWKEEEKAAKEREKYEDKAQKDQRKETEGQEQVSGPENQVLSNQVTPEPAHEDNASVPQEPSGQDTDPNTGAPPAEESGEQTPGQPDEAGPVTQNPETQAPETGAPEKEKEAPKKEAKKLGPAAREENLGLNGPSGHQDKAPQDDPPDDVPDPAPAPASHPAPAPAPAPTPAPEPDPVPIAEPTPTAPLAPAANSVEQITQIQTGGAVTGGEGYDPAVESVLDPAYAGGFVPDAVTGYDGTGDNLGGLNAATLGAEITSQVNEQVADQVSSVVPDSTYYGDGSYENDLAAPADAPADLPAETPAVGVETAGSVDPYVADPYSVPADGYDPAAAIVQDTYSSVEQSSAVDVPVQDSTYVEPDVNSYVEPTVEPYVEPAAAVQEPVVTESYPAETYSTPAETAAPAAAPAPAPAPAPEPVVQQALPAEVPIETPAPAAPVQTAPVEAAPVEAAPVEAAPVEAAPA